MVFAGTVVRAPRAEAPRVSLLSSVVVNRLLVPEPVIDPATGEPVIDPATGQPYAPPPTRWTAGFAYLPRACGDAGVGDPCGGVDAPPKIVEAGLNVPVEVQPWDVWAGDRCSALGARIDLDARARELLEASTAREIEFELWTGTQAQASGWPNPYLRDLPTGNDLNGGTAVPPLIALGALQQALAASGTGGRGMIHAAHRVVSAWFETGGLRREGMTIFDPFDNIVVPGVGYDGSAPDGDVDAAGRFEWAYATDVVDVLLDEPVSVGSGPAETLDRAKNTITTRWERIAAAAWERCRHWGVNIDHGTAVTGIPVRTS